MLNSDKHLNKMAHFLLKKVNLVIRQFDMISDGDRIAVALSGGKDSFSLLSLLIHRQAFAMEKYSVAAIHVIGDARGADLPVHPELSEWLEKSGIEYEIRPTYMADGEQVPLSCQRCTWNRRRTLFEMAKDLGCNKLAFGHHLDDLAQTALLNLVYHGKNETMTPVREYFGGECTLIRPLAYVPEKELKRFAAAHDFPPPPSACPRGEHTQRQHMKSIIAEMRKGCRAADWNLAQSALKEMGVLKKIDRSNS